MKLLIVILVLTVVMFKTSKAVHNNSKHHSSDELPKTATKEHATINDEWFEEGFNTVINILSNSTRLHRLKTHLLANEHVQQQIKLWECCENYIKNRHTIHEEVEQFDSIVTSITDVQSNMCKSELQIPSVVCNLLKNKIGMDYSGRIKLLQSVMINNLQRFYNKNAKKLSTIW